QTRTLRTIPTIVTARHTGPAKPPVTKSSHLPTFASPRGRSGKTFADRNAPAVRGLGVNQLYCCTFLVSLDPAELAPPRSPPRPPRPRSPSRARSRPRQPSATPDRAARSASVTPASEGRPPRPGAAGTGTTLGTATVR